MAYDGLKALAAQYPPQELYELRALAARYDRRYEREILEIAAIAADVSIDSITTLGLEPEVNPQLAEAMERIGYSEEKLKNIDTDYIEGLDGHVWTIKGTYFEVIVRDKLNSGERVGDIQLEPGQIARLAESTDQKGWDVEIVDRSGEIVEQVQLKASDDWSYIKEALEKYPGIRIITTQELDDRAADTEEILSTDIANESLNSSVKTQLTDAVSEASEDTLTDLLHQGIEAGVDAVPVLSAALIGITETGSVLMGRSTVEESLKRGGARLGRAGVYTAIGAGLSAVDAGIISVPTVTALRIAEGRVRNRAEMGDHLSEKTQEIQRELRLSPAFA